MERISVNIQKSTTINRPRSKRAHFINKTCLFLYGSEYTKAEWWKIYYATACFPPELLGRFIKDAKDKSDWMLREKGIKTNTHQHFWVFIKQNRPLYKKKKKKKVKPPEQLLLF